MGFPIPFLSSSFPQLKQNGNPNVAARSLITGSRSTGGKPHFYNHSSTSNHIFTRWPGPTGRFPQQVALMRLTGQQSSRACCLVVISPTTGQDIGTGQIRLVFAASTPTLMLVVPAHLAILPTSSSFVVALPRRAQGQSSSGLLKSKSNPTSSPLLKHLLLDNPTIFYYSYLILLLFQV